MHPQYQCGGIVGFFLGWGGGMFSSTYVAELKEREKVTQDVYI